MSKTEILNLTKKQISKKIYSKIGFSFDFITEITDEIIYILKKSIKNKKLNIKNFGTFKLREKKERLGRNPKNKEIYKINERMTLSFTASKKLKERINNI